MLVPLYLLTVLVLPGLLSDKLNRNLPVIGNIIIKITGSNKYFFNVILVKIQVAV